MKFEKIVYGNMAKPGVPLPGAVVACDYAARTRKNVTTRLTPNSDLALHVPVDIEFDATQATGSLAVLDKGQNAQSVQRVDSASGLRQLQWIAPG